LNHYNIPNKAFQLEKKQIDQLQVPFIAYCDNQSDGGGG